MLWKLKYQSPGSDRGRSANDFTFGIFNGRKLVARTCPQVASNNEGVAGDPEQRKNAILLVAAPELLEFVQKLRDLASRGDHLHDGDVLAEVRGDYCGELLVKASGKVS